MVNFERKKQMIISASRRTDIPAYFSEWFINRIKEKYCTVPNPFNPNQVAFVDLSPENVDVIVFWTRNPQPLLKHLDYLDEKGYKYYFQFTINNYPKTFEKFNPSFENISETFIDLSRRLGNGKIIWRYDPIIITEELSPDYHINNFKKIIAKLGVYTKRVVISIVDNYHKTSRKLHSVDTNYNENQLNNSYMLNLLSSFSQLANEYGLEIQSCAEEIDLENMGIKHGKCIDDILINEEFGLDLGFKKDKGQRLACGCTISKDIGINNTCLMGCEYCYATISHKTAVNNKSKHDPNFSSIIKHELPESTLKQIEDFKSGRKKPSEQITFNF